MPDNPTPQSDEDPFEHVGWWCWRGDNHGHLATTACRSDNVPIHVPADWADEMRAVIQRIEDGDDEQPPAVPASSPLPDQTLRDRIAAALDTLQGTVHHLPPKTRQRVEEVVAAAVPPPADRAAVEEQLGEQLDEAGATIAQQTAALAQADERVEFYEAAHARMRDRLEVTRVRVQRLHSPGANGECQHCHHSSPCPTVQALDDPADVELRRLAAEAQQEAPGSDVGAEFVRQADQPDENGLAAFEEDLRAAAVASCPGYEMSPSPCRCPCYGCKHHCGAHQPDGAQQPECSASISGRCLRESQSETACDTDAGECVGGGPGQGRPVETQQPDTEAPRCPAREPLDGAQCSKQDGHDGAHSDRPGRIWYPVPTEEECCGAEPPTRADDPNGVWGDCWCTLPPGHDSEHSCQPCADRHGAPGWTDAPAAPVQPAEADTDPDPWHNDPKANTQEADLNRPQDRP